MILSIHDALRREAQRVDALTPEERDQIEQDALELERRASLYPMDAALFFRAAGWLRKALR